MSSLSEYTFGSQCPYIFITAAFLLSLCVCVCISFLALFSWAAQFYGRIVKCAFKYSNGKWLVLRWFRRF